MIDDRWVASGEMYLKRRQTFDEDRQFVYRKCVTDNIYAEYI